MKVTNPTPHNKMASLTETNYANVRQELEEFGYSIVHNVLTQEECKNTQKIHQKCLKYFEEKRTTSHCPVPVRVNGLQPQTYGNERNVIDYNMLVEPDLEELKPDILKLI